MAGSFKAKLKAREEEWQKRLSQVESDWELKYNTDIALLN